MAGGLTATDLEIARARLNCARACDGTRSIEQARLVRTCVRAWPYTHVARAFSAHVCACAFVHGRTRMSHANVLCLASDWYCTYCQLQPKGYRYANNA